MILKKQKQQNKTKQKTYCTKHCEYISRSFHMIIILVTEHKQTTLY